MSILYLDIDEKACAWLRELVKDGQIPLGEVWHRDLTTIKPEEVAHFTQRHWCCGIGGWPFAMMIAGVPTDFEIDTVSLPCQPFSVAGKQKGFEDERHLWPAFYELVKELQPAVLVGEQVPAAIRVGWVDHIFDDLEKENYACGQIVLPACSVGAPHIRQRLWWGAARLADSGESGLQGQPRYGGACNEPGRQQENQAGSVAESCRDHFTNSIWWPCRDGKWRPVPGRAEPQSIGLQDEGSGYGVKRLPDAELERHESQQDARPTGLQRTVDGEAKRGGEPCDNMPSEDVATQHAGVETQSEIFVKSYGLPESLVRLWAACDEELFPLAPGEEGRTGILKGAGNAIVPQVAAVFIKSFMEALNNAR